VVVGCAWPSHFCTRVSGIPAEDLFYPIAK
jgi:hypothetical protein